MVIEPWIMPNPMDDDPIEKSRLGTLQKKPKPKKKDPDA